MNNIDHIFNILIIGNKNVGKTSFINRFSNKNISHYNNNIYSILDYSFDYIIWIDNLTIKLIFFDNYNQDDISYNFYIADAVIILCDITDDISYKIDEFINYIKLYSNNIEYYIINNKIDKINFMYDKKEYTSKYYNISVKNNYGINNILKMIIRKLIHQKNNISNKLHFSKIEYIIDENISKKNNNCFKKIINYIC